MQKIDSQKKEDGYDWAVMPDAYFATALVLCEKLLVSQYHVCGPGVQVIHDYKIFKDFRSTHNDVEIIRPLIFNFKQGIELYVKGLAGYHADDYLLSHDIREVFEEVIQRTKEKHDAEKYKFFVNLHTDTWPFIQKYYYGLYIPEHNDFGHPDKMNVSERYPRGGHGYDLGDYYSWVTVGKINEIKNDILSLENIFAEAKRAKFK